RLGTVSSYSSRQASRDHGHLPSFPTRRSSDLKGRWWRPSRGYLSAIYEMTDHDDRPGPKQQRRNSRHQVAEQHGLSSRISPTGRDRKSTRLNSSHQIISYAVSCLKRTT